MIKSIKIHRCTCKFQAHPFGLLKNMISNKNYRKCFPLFLIIYKCVPFCVHLVPFLFMFCTSSEFTPHHIVYILFPFLYAFCLGSAHTYQLFLLLSCIVHALLQNDNYLTQNWYTCISDLDFFFCIPNLPAHR